YWIDLSGERVGYGEIAAGSSREQHTYAGHVWLVLDAEDRPLGVFQAIEEKGEAIVDGENRPTLERRRRGRGERGRRQETGRSPDGKWEASIEKYNLQLHHLENDEVVMLTQDGSEAD